MSVIISNNFILTTTPSWIVGASLDHPIIGWHNVLTPSNIAADFEEVLSPATNLANPATHLKWQSTSTAEQYVTCDDPGVDEIDYLAIAKHNLGSLQVTVSVGYFDNNSPPAWVELVQESILPDDGPTLFRFTPQILTSIKLKIGTSGDSPGDVPEIGAMYIGKLLVLPRKIYQNHAPVKHARTSKVTTGKSEGGHFLGRIVTQEFVQTSVQLSLIDPAFYRQYIDEFMAAAKEIPFFFAWRPQTYPHEVGYVWLNNDPMPTNTPPHGLIAMTLEISGVV